MEDTKTQDAVLRNLQIMGESTQRLSDALKATTPAGGVAASWRPSETSWSITIWEWIWHRYGRSSQMIFRRSSSRSQP